MTASPYVSLGGLKVIDALVVVASLITTFSGSSGRSSTFETVIVTSRVADNAVGVAPSVAVTVAV